MGTSLCSRSRQYLGNWNYMPRYFPHMKHDMACLPHFNVPESLLQVASLVRPIKVLRSYDVESSLSFARYAIFCQFSASVLRTSMAARCCNSTPAEGMCIRSTRHCHIINRLLFHSTNNKGIYVLQEWNNVQLSQRVLPPTIIIPLLLMQL